MQQGFIVYRAYSWPARVAGGSKVGQKLLSGHFKPVANGKISLGRLNS